MNKIRIAIVASVLLIAVIGIFVGKIITSNKAISEPRFGVGEEVLLRECWGLKWPSERKWTKTKIYGTHHDGLGKEFIVKYEGELISVGEDCLAEVNYER